MDSLQHVEEDVSSSSLSSADPTLGDPKGKRGAAVEAIKAALFSRGTVLSDSKLLWLAADFEKEVFLQSQTQPGSYDLVLQQRLDRITATPVLRRADTHGAAKCPSDGSRQLLPESRLCSSDSVGTSAEEGSSGGKGSSPATVLSEVAAPKATPGHGLTEETWGRIQALRVLYFLPLQACFVALVTALRESNELSEKERHFLCSLKRLVLGLVVFLSAERDRIPSRFDHNKLCRLEREVVQILGALLKKAVAGVLNFPPESLRIVSAALRAACLATKPLCSTPMPPGSATAQPPAWHLSPLGSCSLPAEELRLKAPKTQRAAVPLGKRCRRPQAKTDQDGELLENVDSNEHGLGMSLSCGVVAGAPVLKRLRNGEGLPAQGNGKGIDGSGCMRSDGASSWEASFPSGEGKLEPVDACEADLCLCL